MSNLNLIDLNLNEEAKKSLEIWKWRRRLLKVGKRKVIRMYKIKNIIS